MKRRSNVSGGQIKGRRRKTPEPKRRDAPKVQARAKLSPATKETEVARLTRELSEERKQRTATSEVLHLLSGSHGDVNRLFDAILSNATKLCQASFGALFLCEADAFRIVAQHNAPRAYAELRRREPLVRGRPLLRMAETKQLIHIDDVRAYAAANPADKDIAAFAKSSGVRTVLMVPMLNEGEVAGAIVIYRQEVRTFSEREIELMKDFASEAVIAIENARLLNELRQRTDDLSQRTTDLTQALEQQTATSEVLQVISSSPGDLEPVFKTILANATRLCEASFGLLHLYENGLFPVVATHNAPPDYVEMRRRHPMVAPGHNHPLARVAAIKQVLHISDVRTEAGYRERDASFVALVEMLGGRTIVVVPMLKENELVGAITIFRQEVRPFTDKQIELVKRSRHVRQ
jgi:GAF domain-containing protein